MKWVICGTVAVVLAVGAPAKAGDIDFRPIDTDKLVVKPTKAVANLAAGTINLVGQSAAGAVEGNGYIKTLNNLFRVKRTEPKYQANGLPSPNLYPSTMYKNYNTPVHPINMPINR